MKLLLCAFLFVILHYEASAQSDCCDEYCYSRDSEKVQTRQYSSKTAYEVVKGTNYGRQYQVPNCRPVKMWLLSRHGTRLPTRKTIEQFNELEVLRDEIIKNYKVRRTQPDTGGLCREDLFQLQTWKVNSSITPDQDQFLTGQGYHDMKYLAKNYQYIFPEILEKNYQEEKFLFRHTDRQRTRESFKAFVDGLFGENAHSYVKLAPNVNDDKLLTPYVTCNAWQDNDNAKDDPNSEIFKFEQSDLFKKTLADISARLGFKYTLESSQIELIWDICRYEQAWHVDRSSTWCSSFTPKQVSVLEYKEDLKYYYKSGYGFDINTRLSCAAVKDMLDHLNGTTQPQAVAYFTHSAAIQALLTTMGIGKDREPLRGDNYEQMSKRNWRISLLGPFAANLAAIKYECPDSDEKYKVMFFLNQNPVELDWCKVGLCNWSDVMSKYEKFRDADCNEYYCGSSANSISLTLITLLFSTVIYLLK